MQPLNDDPKMTEIAASLRAIRKQKGMTLKDVEAQSHGVWKAVVVGSYERCDRALSLKKAIALANFYKVPLDQLLGLELKPILEQFEKITIDLRRFSNYQEVSIERQDLDKFFTYICAKRRDWNGELLTIRASDLTTLGLMLNMREENVKIWLSSRDLVVKRNK